MLLAVRENTVLQKVPLSSVIETLGLIYNIYFFSLAEYLFLLFFLLRFSYACLLGSVVVVVVVSQLSFSFYWLVYVCLFVSVCWFIG